MLWTVETFTGAELCRIFCSAVECLTVRGKFDGKMKILQTVRILKLRGKNKSPWEFRTPVFFFTGSGFFSSSVRKRKLGENFGLSVFFFTVSGFF